MKLINISNYPSKKWTDEQKKGWEEIFDIYLPNDLKYLSDEQAAKILWAIIKKIKKLQDKYLGNIKIYCAGNDIACFLIYIHFDNNLFIDLPKINERRN